MTRIAKNAPATDTLELWRASLIGFQSAIMIIAKTPNMRTDIVALDMELGTFLPTAFLRLMSMKATTPTTIITSGMAKNITILSWIGGTQ